MCNNQSSDNCQAVNMVNIFVDRGTSSDGLQPGPRGSKGDKGDSHTKEDSGGSGIANMCQ